MVSLEIYHGMKNLVDLPKVSLDITVRDLKNMVVKQCKPKLESTDFAFSSTMHGPHLLWDECSPLTTYITVTSRLELVYLVYNESQSHGLLPSPAASEIKLPPPSAGEDQPVTEPRDEPLPPCDEQPKKTMTLELEFSEKVVNFLSEEEKQVFMSIQPGCVPSDEQFKVAMKLHGLQHRLDLGESLLYSSAVVDRALAEVPPPLEGASSSNDIVVYDKNKVWRLNKELKDNQTYKGVPLSEEDRAEREEKLAKYRKLKLAGITQTVNRRADGIERKIADVKKGIDELPQKMQQAMVDVLSGNVPMPDSTPAERMAVSRMVVRHHNNLVNADKDIVEVEKFKEKVSVMSPEQSSALAAKMQQLIDNRAAAAKAKAKAASKPKAKPKAESKAKAKSKARATGGDADTVSAPAALVESEAAAPEVSEIADAVDYVCKCGRKLKSSKGLKQHQRSCKNSASDAE